MSIFTTDAETDLFFRTAGNLQIATDLARRSVRAIAEFAKSIQVFSRSENGRSAFYAAATECLSLRDERRKFCDNCEIFRRFTYFYPDPPFTYAGHPQENAHLAAFQTLNMAAELYDRWVDEAPSVGPHPQLIRWSIRCYNGHDLALQRLAIENAKAKKEYETRPPGVVAADGAKAPDLDWLDSTDIAILNTLIASPTALHLIDIAANGGPDRNTVSDRLPKLFEAKLIRRPSGAKGRKPISITPFGKQVCESISLKSKQ